MVIGGYADRQVLTRFKVGELDNLQFTNLATRPNGQTVQEAHTTCWAYFRETTTERICKVRRDEVSDREDQDTFNLVMAYFS